LNDSISERSHSSQEEASLSDDSPKKNTVGTDDEKRELNYGEQQFRRKGSFKVLREELDPDNFKNKLERVMGQAFIEKDV
jgi:hypothetical protein